MSEKLYSWLLRLYPSRFRAAYGEEALQLFRDRFRDEHGFLLRLRLWWDLLADSAVSLPHQHGRAQPALAAAHGFPMFVLIDSRPLGPRRWCAGAVLSLLAAFSLVSVARFGHPRLSAPPSFFMPGQVGSNFPHGPAPQMPPPDTGTMAPAVTVPRNCTIEKVEVLPHNILYLKTDCLNIAAAAMASLNAVDAMIFDLRDNRSGSSGTVSFFSRLAAKPSYVLTSGRTTPLASSLTGIAAQPDFELRSEDALATAQKLAQERLRGK